MISRQTALRSQLALGGATVRTGVEASAIASDPRFAELERLIEAAHAAVLVHCDFVPGYPGEAEAGAVSDDASTALDRFVAGVAAIRPQTLTELALQARAAHYWNERLSEWTDDLKDVTGLIGAVLNYVGIAPRSIDEISKTCGTPSREGRP